MLLREAHLNISLCKRWVIMFIFFKYIHQSWRNYLSIRSFPSHSDTGEKKGIKTWPVRLCQICNKGRRTAELLQLSFHQEKSVFQVSHKLRFQRLCLAKLKLKTALMVSFPNKLCFTPPPFTEVRTTDRHGFQTLYCQEHCWPFRNILWGIVGL